jgi:zinc protease
MAFLTVDRDGFSTERKVVEEERRLDLNLPYGELADKGPPLMFGQDPYGHNPLGTFRDLRKATLADVHSWWVRWYTPNNATLVVVGDVKPRRVRALCERYFGWIPPVARPARNLPELAAWDRPQQIMLDLANAPAPGVGLVWRTVPEGHPDALALDVLAMIVGGDPFATIGGSGNSSRLYRRLVAEDHLAVMAGAIQFGFARAGLMGAGAALSPLGGDTARVTSVLRSEMERLRDEGATDAEVEKARNQLIQQLVLQAQTVEGKASLIGRAAVVGRGVAELNSRLERLRSITRADLQRAAQLYLAPQQAMAITVPGSSIWDQLGRLFFGNRKAEEAAPIELADETVVRGRPGVIRPAQRPLHPPIAEAGSSIPNPTIHEHRLANGLRVLVGPNSSGSLVQAVLALPFGSWAEQKPGATELALALLAQGTQKHDEEAFAEALNRYGIAFSGVASHDDSRIQMTCLQEHAERAFELLGEAVTQPTFAEPSFRTVVAQKLTELNLTDSATVMVATREFERHLFGNHPYGRRVSGEAAELSALRRDDIEAQWRRIARPEKATLIIAGPLSDKRALALAERFFTGWHGSAESALAPLPPPAPDKPKKTRILLVDWPGAGQSQICIGGLGISNRDPQKPIASLVGSYFGGTFGSRLMKAIRVEKGATYGALGRFEANRFSGTFKVQTFTKTGSTAETVRSVLAEIRRLIQQPPTSEELSSHKRYFLGSAAARFETPEQIASSLAHDVLNELPLDYFQRSLTAIASADAAQCSALVRRVVDPDHLLIIVVADAVAVSRDLEAIAPVTVLDREGKEIRRMSGG